MTLKDQKAALEKEKKNRVSSSRRLDDFMVTSTSQGARCQICSKPLTDPESIKKGIGPECAKKTINNSQLKRINEHNKNNNSNRKNTKNEMNHGILGYSWQHVISQHLDTIISIIFNDADEPQLKIEPIMFIPPEKKLQIGKKEKIRPDFTLKTSNDVPIFIDAKLRFENIRLKDIEYLYYFPHTTLIFIIFEADSNKSPTWNKRFTDTITKRIRQFNRRHCKFGIKPLEINDILDRIQWYGRSDVKLDIVIRSIEDLKKLARKYEREFTPYETLCPICQKKRFSDKILYTMHLKVCGGKMTCPNCGRKDFVYKNHYDSHIRACGHKLTCQNCGKKNFKYKSDFESHVKACGGKLVCPSCRKNDFSYKSHYDDHVKACGGKLKCPNCGKNNFRYKRDFDVHVRDCGKKFRCKKCNEEFNSQKRLRNHVKACGGKLRCPRCGKNNFKYANHYHDHVRACGGKLKCPDCGRADFEYKRQYDNHVKACGGKLRCPRCGKDDFNYATSFFRHLKKQTCKLSK